MPSRPVSPMGSASCPSTRSSDSSRPRSFSRPAPRRTSGASRSSPRRFSRWRPGGARPRPRPRSRYCRLRLCPLPSSRRFRRRDRGSCPRPRSRPSRQQTRWTSSTTPTPFRSCPSPPSSPIPRPCDDAAARVEEERPEHGAEGARSPWVEESVPTAERGRPAVKPAHRESSLQDDVHLLRELTALLPAVGPLAIEVRVVDGVTLLSATSPAVDDEVAVTAAALLLPLMRPGRAPWPVDQVTLRGPRAALILTPLGPLPDGGPVLAASVPPGGGVALLELRCRQAAAAHAAACGCPA